MSTPGARLVGFAFGERVEGTPPRSLGYSLLTPLAPAAWSAEVETLARQLQETPYPDDWPPTDLFCSTILADGQRLVAVARYGLVDHTPSRRHGGLELIGVVGPGWIEIASALAINRWLRSRRDETTDLHALGGEYALEDLLASAPPETAASNQAALLPILMRQEGVLQFMASTPDEPDQRLGLLEQYPLSNWQWLPLVGAGFPLKTVAQRGPLVAWTLPPAGITHSPEPKTRDAKPRRGRMPTAAISVLCLLLAANLAVALWPRPRPEKDPEMRIAQPEPEKMPVEREAEVIALALHAVLQRRQADKEWSTPQLLAENSRLVAEDDRLRVTSLDARTALGAIGLLSRRPASRVEAIVREALERKGYDPDLIDLACRRIRERLAADANGSP